MVRGTRLAECGARARCACEQLLRDPRAVEPHPERAAHTRIGERATADVPLHDIGAERRRVVDKPHALRTQRRVAFEQRREIRARVPVELALLQRGEARRGIEQEAHADPFEVPDAALAATPARWVLVDREVDAAPPRRSFAIGRQHLVGPRSWSRRLREPREPCAEALLVRLRLERALARGKFAERLLHPGLLHDDPALAHRARSCEVRRIEHDAQRARIAVCARDRRDATHAVRQGTEHDAIGARDFEGPQHVVDRERCAIRERDAVADAHSHRHAVRGDFERLRERRPRRERLRVSVEQRVVREREHVAARDRARRRERVEAVRLLGHAGVDMAALRLVRQSRFARDRGTRVRRRPAIWLQCLQQECADNERQREDEQGLESRVHGEAMPRVRARVRPPPRARRSRSAPPRWLRMRAFGLAATVRGSRTRTSKTS